MANDLPHNVCRLSFPSCYLWVDFNYFQKLICHYIIFFKVIDGWTWTWSLKTNVILYFSSQNKLGQLARENNRCKKLFQSLMCIEFTRFTRINVIQNICDYLNKTEKTLTSFINTFYCYEVLINTTSLIFVEKILCDYVFSCCQPVVWILSLVLLLGM